MAMTRAAFHEAVELLLDRRLDLRIERAGRLVEDEDRRVLEDQPGDGDALALAAGELDAALADVGVVAGAAAAVLEAEDEVVRLRRASAAAMISLLARLGPAVRMLSRTERWSSEVSCVTTPIAARRLSCVTSAMSCPSIRMRPPSRS